MFDISQIFSIERIREMIIALPAIVVGLTFHEYAHARVADYFGDDTPAYQGRLTLSPLPHIDPIGLLLLMFAGFGWAKPVQVNPLRFKGVTMKQGMLLVSLAGPVMNFGLAVVSAFFITKIFVPLFSTSHPAFQILLPFVWINLVLGVFNLIPVPPLDGSKILAGILPDRMGGLIYALESYGTIILLLLVFSNVFDNILSPIIKGLFYMLMSI